MENRTILKEFFLAGLSDLPTLQLPLFLFFLLIYLLTLLWNSLIISLIVTDSRLHVPMYFFLGNLASLDLCCSSVTVPRMLFDLHTKTKKITINSSKGRSKVFSTCTSHLTVVFIYYGCGVFNYFRPNTSHHFTVDKVVSIFYTVILPLLNPLIYSLRNQDLRTPLQDALRKVIPVSTKNSSKLNPLFLDI
ncbi:hypothetical protein AB205_0010160 [Aquarana catesbeiana]|uniref:G-protein coupled receptors family 1 profile domain-containing protein n=1 Tax=Aquarana catesbeiana TaxID=8400 RepID=A0A2G9RI20_AQUCT|nr:hypothetical protein AB205_0010160 [Aquarana catesbeiana]